MLTNFPGVACPPPPLTLRQNIDSCINLKSHSFGFFLFIFSSFGDFRKVSILKIIIIIVVINVVVVIYYGQ